MKKLFAIVVLGFITSTAFAQGTLDKGAAQLNAGLGFSAWGTPVYFGADFGVHEDITIGPRISHRNYGRRLDGFNRRQSVTALSFNGNYHFNRILGIAPEWDLYAGATLSYFWWSSVNWAGSYGSGLGLDFQVGARYFFSDKVGLNLELGGGHVAGGLFGITIKL
jgi:outer membrane immunogenic protein